VIAAGETGNIAERLRANARRFPERKGLLFPAGTDAKGSCVYGHQTFRAIDEQSDAYARGFRRAGIGKGTKTILMVKPGPDLFAITFALLKLGAVPVVVDPGMGVKRMLHCYETVGADAFVGIPIAHAVRVLSPRAFASLKTWITVGTRYFWGGPTLRGIAEHAAEPLPIEPMTADDLMIINFTTGSTGPAKGVEYTHGIADAMVRQIVSSFGQGEDAVTLATLPLFAIFDLLIGSTSILPPMDPTKPAHVDPRVMIDAIHTYRVTHMFASPAFLHRVGPYAAARGITFPSFARVTSGGAPVAPSIVACFKGLLGPEAQLDTTYGATEALPIASIESRAILGETQALTRTGKGTCVGEPVPGLEARIIRISDEPIAAWSADLELPTGEVGEIAIRGPMVSTRYHQAPHTNAAMKIADAGGLWHRTGDLGAIDEKGRLWYASRKSQRVTTPRGPLFTVQWEGIFDAHPDVYRSALVGVGPRGSQEPVVCIELRKSETRASRERIEGELRALASANPLTRSVKAFLFHPGFPVDIRHNAKINREELAEWAASIVGDGRGAGAGRAWLFAIPIAGWLFVLFGLAFPLAPALRAVWWIDVFLSVVVHGLQLFLAIPKGKRAGYPTAQIVVLTFLLGGTWWKFIKPIPLPAGQNGT
jgi:acyl-CoA synthetase (AMP-forming)/AMP-acid ligase II